MKRFSPSPWLSAFALWIAAAVPANAAVVINELMYHPVSDLEADEYLELRNTGSNGVDLLNWAFTDGIAFTFTESVVVPPDGYLVVALDPNHIRDKYGIENVTGPFIGRLSNAGELIVLEDNQGRIADEVEYGDEPPWPLAADGDGPALERINPNAPGSDPFNWRISSEPEPGEPWGTPGRPNSQVSAELPPRISDIRHRPERPLASDPLFIRADVEDDSGVFRVQLEYRVTRVRGSVLGQSDDPFSVPADEWLTIDMFDDGTRGDREPGDGSYEVALPMLPAGTLVEYRIHATDFSARRSVAPDPAGFPRQFALFIRNAEAPPGPPQYTMLVPDGEMELLRGFAAAGPGDPSFNQTVRGVFIGEPGDAYSDVAVRFEGGAETLRSAKPGWMVFFNGGFRPGGVDEYRLKSVFYLDNPARRGDAGLHEALARRVFQQTGVPAGKTQPVSLNLNGGSQGAFLRVESLNGDFLDRIGRDRGAGLYFSDGTPEIPGDESPLAGLGQYRQAYDNITRPDSDFAGLTGFIESLNGLSGDELSAFVRQNLDVEMFLGYLAAGAVTANEDRAYRNHYLYRNPETGLWEVYPGGLEDAFGDVNAHVLANVRGFPSEQGVWPLADKVLSSPAHRARYAEILRELLQTVYSPQFLHPFVDRYVENNAELSRGDIEVWGGAAGGYAPLLDHAAALKAFIQERRREIARQLEFPPIASNAGSLPGAPGPDDEIEFRVDVLAAEPPVSVELVAELSDGTARIPAAPSGEIPTEYRAAVPPQPDGTAIAYHFEIAPAGGGTVRRPASGEFGVTVNGDPALAARQIVINEIMYHGPVADNEWIEVYNPGPLPADLGGWSYRDNDDTHVFPIPDGTVLPADGYLVIARDASLIPVLYGRGIRALGDVPYNLANGGDAARLFNRLGALTEWIEFDDEFPWPPEADGEGATLELFSHELDNQFVSSWLPSETAGGTPGRRNSVSPFTAVGDWALHR